jgi:hypothetical protein
MVVVVRRPWLPPPIRYCHSTNEWHIVDFMYTTGHGILQLCTIIEVYSCNQLCRVVVVVVVVVEVLLHTIPVHFKSQWDFCNPIAKLLTWLSKFWNIQVGGHQISFFYQIIKYFGKFCPTILASSASPIPGVDTRRLPG